MATSYEELTQWKRLWCWEGLGAGGKGDDRGWDGWMASPTQWTWVWVNSGRWWWTGRPGVLQFMGSQRVRQDWATELNWTETFRIAMFSQWIGYFSIMEWSYLSLVIYFSGFPCSSVGKECACRRPRFNSWVGKIPWRRKWQPTPVFWECFPVCLGNPMDRGAWQAMVLGVSSVKHDLATKPQYTFLCNLNKLCL